MIGDYVPALDYNRRCTGKCCGEFVMGYSRYHDVQRWARNVSLGINRLNSPGDPDLPFIGRMLVFLRNETDHDRYTCLHWDRETRLCREYAQRPRMCSEYPYGGECIHCGMRGPQSTEGPGSEPEGSD